MLRLISKLNNKMHLLLVALYTQLEEEWFYMDAEVAFLFCYFCVSVPYLFVLQLRLLIISLQGYKAVELVLQSHDSIVQIIHSHCCFRISLPNGFKER